MQTDIAAHDTEQNEGNTMYNNPNRGSSRKTKTKENLMKSILPGLLTGSLLLSAAMAGETGPSTGTVAKDVPLGHKDFYPSPQRSIGYRGDGNGAYPDARPVSEWSESKNFLWKTPVPNYGNSSPLVVGDKVFVVSEPGWQSDCPTLACYDLITGKQLWVSDVDQFSGLPEAERADARARRKKYFEILRAANRLAYQAAQAKDDAEKEKLLEEIKTVSGGALKSMAAYCNTALTVASGKELGLTQKYQFNAPTWWYSDIGMVYTTPCSDGQRVFVATAYDSLHAFDLTGKQVWQQWHRDGFGKKGVPSDIRFTDSPLLVDGVLVRYANYRVRAYDPATGAMKWQTDGLRPAPGHSCGQMGVVRVPAAQGQPGFTALLTYSGELLRLRDGAVLKRGLATAGVLHIVSDGADTAFVAHTKEINKDAVLDPVLDGPGLLALRFGQAADGSVTVTRRWRLENAGGFLDHGHAPVYHNGVLYGGVGKLTAIDAATGFVLWTAGTGPTTGGAKPYSGPVKVPVGGGFESPGWALGGDLLVAQFCHGYTVAIDTNGERRNSTFLPPMPDLTGPKRDQVIAQSATDKYAMWYGWNLSRSLPVFAGQRILVRSFDWLYCFGPAVEGTPGDDAGKVATIRAETDLGKLESYLADASAQIRFEALKRLTAPVTSAPVVRILREDPYAENRAAAYRALGATAGWREIAALIPKAMPTASNASYGAAEATVLRQDLVHTFRVLGDEGRALVAREWTAAKEPLTKRFLLHIAQSLTWRIEPILAEAKLAMEKPPREMPQWHAPVPVNRTLLRLLPDYLARLDAAADPVLAEAMIKAYPQEWALYTTLARHLPAEKLLAWIEPIALTGDSSIRGYILSAWRAIGPVALPSMERVRAAMAGRDPAQDKAAASYAENIAKQIAEMKGEGKTPAPQDRKN